MTGVAAVQSRIAEIQGTIEAWRTGMAAASTTSASSAAAVAALAAATSTSSTSTSFADALAASTASLAASGTTTTAGTSAGAGAGTGQALVEAAEKYIGVPYVWGGTNPATGLDCSGLVQRAMADLGVEVPRVARDQAKVGTAIASMAEAKVGDLLVFDGGSHIAIYVGDGRMIDAPKPGKSVAIRDVYETPSAIRRVLPEAAPATTVALATTVAPATTMAAPIASDSTLTTAADLQRYALTMMSEVAA